MVFHVMNVMDIMGIWWKYIIRYPLGIKHGNGKSTINGGSSSKIIDFYGPFSIAIFDDTGGHITATTHGGSFHPFSWGHMRCDGLWRAFFSAGLFNVRTSWNGKRLQKTMEHHHFSWENWLEMAIFNSYVSHYQRVAELAVASHRSKT